MFRAKRPVTERRDLPPMTHSCPRLSSISIAQKGGEPSLPGCGVPHLKGGCFVTAVQVSWPLAGSGWSCINAAVALVALRSASAGSGVTATPSSNPTIRPSQRSPRYCVAISIGSPEPMSPFDWAFANSSARALRVASRPATSRAWAISGERVVQRSPNGTSRSPMGRKPRAPVSSQSR